MSPAAPYPPYEPDEPLVQASAADGQARLAVYPVAAVQVVLGRGSKPAVELHQRACQADGVAVVRRRGGGCAVVLDPGNAVVSLALPVEGLGQNLRHFARITRWLCAGLSRLGIPGVHQAGISDLARDERKVGGACIYRTTGLLYYSATLLVAPDVGLMERYLRHPPREPDYRQGRDHSSFVAALDPGRDDAGQLAAALGERLELSLL